MGSSCISQDCSTSCPACAAGSASGQRGQQDKSPVRRTHRAKYPSARSLRPEQAKNLNEQINRTSPPKINESESIINVISKVISITSDINNGRNSRNSKTSASPCFRNIIVNRIKCPDPAQRRANKH